MLTIAVKLTNVATVPVLQPACARAQLLATMLGTRTFGLETVERIKQLGFRITVQSIN